MKTRHFLFLAFFIYLLGISTLAAQSSQSALLRGTITNQKGEPVPYGNVALLSPEGVLLEGTVTDEAGVFSISTTKTARVKLVVSSLGYTSYTSEEFELQAGLQKDFGTLVLADEVTGLDEVTVKASRPQIIIEPDKTIVNVEGTVMAEGANALDVLGRSPGVFITSDGSINLNGRTGVTVMINDRPMYMSAADLTSFLRFMPADNIRSIEVITSPSARFDAEGAAGVINIQLKKNTVDGVFGNVMLGGQYNGKAAPNTGLTLNVKKGKWTTNGTFNYNENVEINDLEITRNFQVEGGKSTFLQDSRIVERSHTPSFTGAANYELTPTQNLGINIQASTSASNGLNNSGTLISNPGQANGTSFTSINDSEDHRSRVFTNLHYDAKLDTLGGKISADLDFTVMDMTSDALLNNSYSNGLTPPKLSTDRVLTLNDMYYTILTSKVDWIKPLKGGKVVEAGLKGSWVESDNDLDLSRGVGDGPLQADPNSNRFIYQENVLAAYTSLKGDFSPKLSYQAGLRMENSDVTGTSKTLNQVNSQRYTNLFPSVFLQHKISDNYQVVYNVNRRITRPNYRLLNPFVYYIDPLTTEKGNPSLRPQYSTNLEMDHVIKGAYQFTLGYSVTEDAFMQVFEQDEEARSSTTFTANFDKTKNFNFQGVVPIELASWWNTSNLVQVNYNKFKSLLGKDVLDISQVSYLLRTQHNFTLPKGFKLELVGIYLSPQIWGQGEVGGFGWVDAGMTKSLMKDKLALSINGGDLFRTQLIRASINFAEIDTQIRQYRNEQNVRITLRYTFSKGQSFRVNSNSGSSEERKRLD
jgi:hypothetical protein